MNEYKTVPRRGRKEMTRLHLKKNRPPVKDRKSREPDAPREETTRNSKGEKRYRIEEKTTDAKVVDKSRKTRNRNQNSSASPQGGDNERRKAYIHSI